MLLLVPKNYVCYDLARFKLGPSHSTENMLLTGQLKTSRVEARSPVGINPLVLLHNDSGRKCVDLRGKSSIIYGLNGRFSDFEASQKDRTAVVGIETRTRVEDPRGRRPGTKLKPWNKR